MSTILKTVALTAGSIVLVLGGSSAANAYDYKSSKACSGGGGVLNMTISYDLTSTHHVWGVMYGKATGDAGKNNNFRGRIYQGSSKVWEHSSADNYGDGELWQKSVLTASGSHLKTLRSTTEKVEVHAWFDQWGNDPECTASVVYN